MYCKNCGCQNDDSINFCQNCGVELQESAPIHSFNGEEPDLKPNEKSSPRTATEDTPLLAIVRKHFTSNLFLIIAVLFTVSAGISLLSGLSAPLNKTAVLSIIEDAELPQEFYSRLPMAEIESFLESRDFENLLKFASAGNLTSAVMPTLLAVGFWLTFSGAKKNAPFISTSGITLIKVIKIIEFVFSVICCSVLILVCFLFTPILSFFPDIFLPSSYSFLPILGFALAILGITVLFALAVIIVYYVFLLKSIKSLKSTVNGSASVKGMSFTMVICFIVGAVNALSALGFVLSPINFIATGSLAAAYIMLGLLISRFKTDIYPFEAPFYSNYMPDAEK